MRLPLHPAPPHTHTTLQGAASRASVVIAPAIAATEQRIPSSPAPGAALPAALLTRPEVQRVNSEVTAAWPHPASRDPLTMMHT